MKRAFPLVVALVATTLFTGTSAASAQPSLTTVSQDKPADPGKADPPGLAKGHDKNVDNDNNGKKPAAKPKAKATPKAKTTPKPKAAVPGKAKGHDKDKAKGKAVGHNRPTSPAPAPAPAKGQGSGNENKKITFCHVPPGNPANGHLITTSVNAITPGHTNHSGDIIPPFSYLKHGSTVTFAGQNWDAAGQATLANGCKPADPAGTVSAPGTSQTPAAGSSLEAAPAGTPVAGSPVAGTPGTGLVTDDPTAGTSKLTAAGTSTTSASADVPKDESVIDGILPSTGGARLAFLVAGLALVAGGVLLVTRRRRTV